jgi:hypothetical protein
MSRTTTDALSLVRELYDVADRIEAGEPIRAESIRDRAHDARQLEQQRGKPSEENR